MTSSKKLSRIQVLLLSLISSLAFPAHAGATPVIAGKFTLSNAAKWGSVILPAGEYTFAVEDSVSPPPVVIFAADGTGKGIVLPAFVSDIKGDDTGKMILEVRHGERVVTALYLERLGIVLHYGVGRPNVELAQKKAVPDSRMSSYLEAK
ncbi:MAG TPA: hypothetical protein VNO32_03980 [Candidatus Acidoferrum sp.]|nr:hypothetical protein [Candidatus Acidoferrum sp.]